MNYIDYLYDSQASDSMLFYTFIVLIVCFIGSLSQRSLKNLYYIKFRLSAFVVASGLLLFFSFFCDVGSDLNQYRYIFLSSSLEDYDEDIFLEPGFKLLCALIKLTDVNEYFGVGILKSIILVFVFLSIYRLRNNIHIGLSIMAYTAIVYFMSFNLLRICLAASIVSLAWSYLLTKNFKTSAILLLVSMTIHYTSVITLIPLSFIYVFRNISDKKFEFFAILLSFAIILLSTLFINTIVSQNQYMSKYDQYLDNKGSFGMMQIVYYFPLIFLAHTFPVGTMMRKVSIALAWIGFAIAMCGYSNGMISRMNVYFIYNTMFLLPIAVNQLRFSKTLKFQLVNLNSIIRCSYVSLFLFSYIYILFRFCMDIPVYFLMSDIYPYKMWI